MSKKSLLILEIIWIAVGICCLAAGIRYGLQTGGPKIFIFVVMAVVSFAFAWIRDRQRKKN